MPAFDEVADYDVFFEKKLTPLLKRLKSECRIADSWGIAIIVAILLLFGSIIAVQADYVKDNGGLLITFCIIFLIVSVYQYTEHNDDFTDDFKTSLIKEIISHVNPGMIYKPDTSISQGEYVTSSLLRYRYNNFDGSDYIEGKYKDVSFHCSQVLTQSDDDIIFKGLFFVAGINSRFSACTYMWDKEAVQLATSIADEAYRLLPMPYVADVPVTDTPFSKYFRVCSTDTYEATKILTTISPNKIIELTQLIQRPMNISFVLGNCYVAIPFTVDIFGPDVYVPGDKEETKKYFNSVNLIFQIIDYLELSKLQ